MSIWRLLMMLVRLFMAHRQHRKGMDQLRTSHLRTNAIQAVLAAYRTGDYEAALQAAETMKDDKANLAAYYFFSGTMLMNIGRLQEAEQQLRRNLAIAPDDKRKALGSSSLGQVLIEMQRYDEAVECFHTSLRYWPDRGSSHRDIAEARLRQGVNALDVLQFAQRGVQEDRDRSREEQNGRPEIREVCDINLAEDLATLAWAVAAGSRDRAEVDRLVDEAVLLVGSACSPAALVHYHAGQAYLSLGDSAKSELHFAEAARIDPNGIRGRSARDMTAVVNR
jgi:tetratricopeptide (TPR) repeat protein